MASAITNAQSLHLQIIEAAGVVNNLNGAAIARSLRQNRDLWISVVMARESRALAPASGEPPLAASISLIHLRDLPEDHVNLDTLFVLPTPGAQTALEELARTWQPDEVVWFPILEACKALGTAAVKYKGFKDPARFLLKAWWD